MLLINCEVNLVLTRPANYVITNSIGTETFYNNRYKLYVPVVTLSTQDNAKIFEQVNQGSK